MLLLLSATARIMEESRTTSSLTCNFIPRDFANNNIIMRSAEYYVANSHVELVDSCCCFREKRGGGVDGTK